MTVWQFHIKDGILTPKITDLKIVHVF